jgi:hypothetical protein
MSTNYISSMCIKFVFLVALCYASELDRRLIRQEDRKDTRIISASGDIGEAHGGYDEASEQFPTVGGSFQVESRTLKDRAKPVERATSWFATHARPTSLKEGEALDGAVTSKTTTKVPPFAPNVVVVSPSAANAAKAAIARPGAWPTLPQVTTTTTKPACGPCNVLFSNGAAPGHGKTEGPTANWTVMNQWTNTTNVTGVSSLVLSGKDCQLQVRTNAGIQSYIYTPGVYNCGKLPDGSPSPQTCLPTGNKNIVGWIMTCQASNFIVRRVDLNEFRWVTGPFGDCAKCQDGPTQFRWTKCQNAFTREWAEKETKCEDRWKPATMKNCNCKRMPCNGNTTFCQWTKHLTTGNPSEDNVFDEIGCFKKPANMTPKAVSRNTPGNSYDCHGWNSSLPCHGGLPFYAFTANPMTPTACFSFCSRKGLDIFGLDGTTSPVTCRCGVTTGVVKIWDHAKNKTPVPGLVFDPTLLTLFGDEVSTCPLRIYRYAGWLNDGVIPPGRTRLTAADVKYQDQIVARVNLTNAQMEDSIPAKWNRVRKPQVNATNATKSNATAKLLDVGQDPLWERPCYPSNCGAGGGPWGSREDGSRTSESISVNAGDWQEYTVIKYFFDPMVDRSRKEAFREATIRWMYRTCVVFQEVLPPVAPPAVSVSIQDENSCWAWPLGKPYPDEYAEVNLGWCSNYMHIGNMMHEIGHILGMNHKQQRPDAGQRYMGKGPYLKILWDHISESSVPQYEADMQDYMGSRNDGSGDLFDAGYAPYDFESIMHYPNTGGFETIPSSAIDLVGNRDHLSDLDILQINDLYQCRRPTTTTIEHTWMPDHEDDDDHDEWKQGNNWNNGNNGNHENEGNNGNNGNNGNDGNNGNNGNNWNNGNNGNNGDRENDGNNGQRSWDH